MCERGRQRVRARVNGETWTDLTPVKGGSDGTPEGSAGEEGSCSGVGEGRHGQLLGGGYRETWEGQGGEKGESVGEKRVWVGIHYAIDDVRAPMVNRPGFVGRACYLLSVQRPASSAPDKIPALPGP